MEDQGGCGGSGEGAVIGLADLSDDGLAGCQAAYQAAYQACHRDNGLALLRWLGPDGHLAPWQVSEDAMKSATGFPEDCNAGQERLGPSRPITQGPGVPSGSW